MRKIIIMLTMILSISVSQSNAQSKGRKYQGEYEISPRLTGAIAGGAFIIAGLLQRPDDVWVSDPNSQLVNSYGERGYFKQQKIWECPVRSATIGTGLLIIGFSFTYKF